MSFGIETAQLRYRAGRHFTIQGVDLRVPEGEVTGFLGPNGAGKTTVIRLILGLLRPESGTVTLLGRPMPAEAPDLMARIGYVPERPHFDLTLRVEEILRFQSAFYRRWDADLARRLMAALEIDGGQEFGRLSKGQKAKVMILVALAQRPTLLVLDEPTDGLDPVVRREILDILLERMRVDGITTLISSHLVHELEGLCTRIAIMDGGALVDDASLESYRNRVRRLSVGPLNDDAWVNAPFRILDRRANGDGGIQLVVRDWDLQGLAFLTAQGVTVHGESTLGLEEGYVHLLRAFRRNARGTA